MKKDVFEKIKQEKCEKCTQKDKEKCEGLTITIDAKARCVAKDIIE